MNRKDLQALLSNPYLYWTEDEINDEIAWLESKEANPLATLTIKKDAAIKCIQAYDVKQVFAIVKPLKDSKGQPFDTNGHTPASLLHLITGREVGELKTSMGMVAANKLDEAWGTTVTWVKKASAATGQALVKFGKK